MKSWVVTPPLLLVFSLLLCFSQFGWCGIESVISKSRFDEMLKHKDAGCHAVGFYKYEDFIEAAKSFPEFGTTGDDATRKKEVAAFFGQTSHETTGGMGWHPDDGPYYWGYCYKEEINPPSNYCNYSTTYPCVPGKSYHGRGPIQLSWNYNYGPFGEYIKKNLLNDPDLVARDGVISFKAAIWFWMTKQYDKPSCHDVITGKWKPSQVDIDAKRFSGYGVITNIINGGIECGVGYNKYVEDRIGFYKRYCTMFGVDPGPNLDCYEQRRFGSGVLLDATM